MTSADKVKSVDGLLRRVRDLKDASTHIHLYRGQCDDRELLPRLFRPPSVAKTVRDMEKGLLHRFKNDCPYLLPSRPDNDWDWLSLGQHFGLPTRLLDWTSNPLNALFFALDADAHPLPTVYVYHATEKQIVDEEYRDDNSPFGNDQTKIFQPSWHSPRVAAQAGWHTVHRVHETKGRGKFFRPLDDMKFHQQRLDKIPIDPHAARALFEELVGLGIRHATVYGDLGAVCVAIARDFGFTRK